MRIKTWAVAAATLTTILLPASALASCKNGICVSGQDTFDDASRSSRHVVQLSTTLGGITHYNLSIPGKPQQEIGRNVTQFIVPMANARPTTVSFSVQACVRGGTFSRSSCSPWANFTHTAR